MFLYKILKTKNRFRAYPTPQAVQTTGSTGVITIRARPTFNPQKETASSAKFVGNIGLRKISKCMI